MRALVVGGTGPTGHFIVNGLLQRGFDVAILHRGSHEIDEIPAQVEHIHTDPYDQSCLEQALASREFSLCIATYGRLRAIAAVLEGRVERFISAGGAPAYRGYMNPYLFTPHGLPVPTREDAPKVEQESEDSKGFRIRRTEQTLFELQPRATHFRYPFVYGPYQLVPREWLIVRRIRDGRGQIILPDGGLTLHSFGYAENVAHALLLAVDKPAASEGRIYNVADEEVLSLRQVTEIIAAALDHALEIINMPYELAPCTRPFIMQPLSTHRVQDVAAIRADLGYRDKVVPAEALARTAHWLMANPPESGGIEEQVLQDPFDYAAEDQLLERWRQLTVELAGIDFKQEPGLGMAYSGPGGRERGQQEYEE
ncbi:MAG: NAD-dependent epimerase/dehydratase family protein [Gammaproteobacteria bacterium]|nr:NAD-dependent epimerase/dehydratase family protein [Gammaproteobacteria bacterium]